MHGEGRLGVHGHGLRRLFKHMPLRQVHRVMRAGRLKSVALALLAAGLVVTNVLLIRQNLSLRASLESSGLALDVGSKVAALTGESLSGNRVRVDFSGTGPKRVFLYFSSSCPYTDYQFPYWCRLFRKADASKFQFLALASDQEERATIEAYLKTRDCDLSSQALLLRRDLLEALKLSITPSTLIVKEDGTVEKAWAGLWHREDVVLAESMFEAGRP